MPNDELLTGLSEHLFVLALFLGGLSLQRSDVRFNVGQLRLDLLVLNDQSGYWP